MTIDGLLGNIVKFPHPDAVRSSSVQDGYYLEANYIALERHATRNTCKPLRIPFKQWMRVNPADPLGWQWEQANSRAIEVWANALGTCCVEGEEEEEEGGG
jgi:hypothetical protein